MDRIKYFFDIDVAKKYGVNAAIMIENMRFWIHINEAKKVNFYDGKTWTYNSIEAFKSLFPFWTENQIRHILRKLIQQKVLVKGNYNKHGYDRTLWYAFANTAIDLICEKCQMNLSHLPNEFVKNPKPIPDINTDINKEKNNVLFENSKKVLEYLNKKTGKKYRPTVGTLSFITARLREGFTKEECIKVIDTMWHNWAKTSMEKYLKYDTLFRASKFQKYLNADEEKRDDMSSTGEYIDPKKWKKLK